MQTVSSNKKNMSSETWYTDGRTETINGLSVFFKLTGKGESLICIHGFPSSSWDFEAIWPAITGRFEVLIHDLIGLGKSAKPSQPLPISLQADIIEGLATKAGITRAHILAHDLGDTIAQELLARQFEKSSKVTWLSCVFLNGGLFPEAHRAFFIQKLLLSSLGSFVVRFMSEKSMQRSLTKVFSKVHPPTEAFIHTTWKLTSENNGLSMLPRLIQYIKERKTYRERWVNPLVNKVVPIRLITGIEDPISGKHAAVRFNEVVPDADIVLLENAGHYPHIEIPEEVLKAFFDFHDNL